MHGFQADYGLLYMTRIVITSDGINVEEENREIDCKNIMKNLEDARENIHCV